MSKATYQDINRGSRVVGIICLLLAVTLLIVLHSNMVKAREYRGSSLEVVTVQCENYASYRGPDEVFHKIYPHLWFKHWCGEYVGQINRLKDAEYSARLRETIARVDAEIAAEALNKPD